MAGELPQMGENDQRPCTIIPWSEDLNFGQGWHSKRVLILEKYVEATQHFTAQVTQPLNSLQNNPAIHFHPRWKDGLRRP